MLWDFDRTCRTTKNEIGLVCVLFVTKLRPASFRLGLIATFFRAESLPNKQAVCQSCCLLNNVQGLYDLQGEDLPLVKLLERPTSNFAAETVALVADDSQRHQVFPLMKAPSKISMAILPIKVGNEYRAELAAIDGMHCTNRFNFEVSSHSEYIASQDEKRCWRSFTLIAN